MIDQVFQTTFRGRDSYILHHLRKQELTSILRDVRVVSEPGLCVFCFVFADENGEMVGYTKIKSILKKFKYLV